MSKSHPNNGPSLSAAPPKKWKPLTDKELADSQAQGKAAMEETIQRAARKRESNELLRRLIECGVIIKKS
jgi:hypothetical protein